MTSRRCRFLRSTLPLLPWFSLALRLFAAPQTITWTSPTTNTVLLLNQAYPLTATASSGLPVTFRVQSGPAVVASGTVTATNVGTVVLVAEQVGDVTHPPASAARTLNRSRFRASSLGQLHGAADNGRGVFIEGNRAYVAHDGGGLSVFDVSKPSTPVRVGGFNSSGYAISVRVVEHLAYVADSVAGLQILDVSNPAAPIRLGGFDTTGEAFGVEVAGDIAYVADYNAGLQILDVSNPASPARLGGFDTSGEARGAQVVGNIAYVADGSAGLQILDVRNPGRPERLGSFDSSASASAVKVVGNLAYLASTYAGLQILDVSNPANPVLVGGYGGTGYAEKVEVMGNLAYVGDSWIGLQILDVSNPTSPILVGLYDTDSFAYDLHVSGNLVYRPFGAGLQVLQIHEGLTQALTFTPPALVTLLGDTRLSLAGTSDSGLTASFKVVSGRATLQGDQLVFTGTGPVVVRAELPGNEQFFPLTEDRTIIVKPILVPISNPRLLPNGRLSIEWEGVPLAGVVCEVSTDLADWNAVAVLGSGGNLVELPVSSDVQNEFFRVRLK